MAGLTVSTRDLELGGTSRGVEYAVPPLASMLSKARMDNHGVIATRGKMEKIIATEHNENALEGDRDRRLQPKERDSRLCTRLGRRRERERSSVNNLPRLVVIVFVSCHQILFAYICFFRSRMYGKHEK